jgi:hypothetical protein
MEDHGGGDEGEGSRSGLTQKIRLLCVPLGNHVHGCVSCTRACDVSYPSEIAGGEYMERESTNDWLLVPSNLRPRAWETSRNLACTCHARLHLIVSSMRKELARHIATCECLVCKLHVLKLACRLFCLRDLALQQLCCHCHVFGCKHVCVCLGFGAQNIDSCIGVP